MAGNINNNEAKESFITRIINLNPEGYVGCYDKKYYFWENGIQIAISLTCPKVPVGENKEEVSKTVHLEPSSMEITPEEKEKLTKFLEALGV